MIQYLYAVINLKFIIRDFCPSYLSGRYVLEEALSYSRCPMTKLEKSGHPLPSLWKPGKNASASTETI
jgi:hypothetical protein